MNERFQKICQEASLVGASSVVYQNGRIVEELSYGKRNLEANLDSSVHTIYRIASISKVVVAVALMKLHEMGKVCLDDDISNYLGFKVRNPYFPNDPITLRLMMTQTSSITDGDYENGYNSVNGTNIDCRLQDLLLEEGKYFSYKTFDKNKPGTTFIYSNFNCGIIACIIEKLSGMLFTEFVKKEVLKPLGMDASFVITDIYHYDQVASLYVVKDNKITLNRSYNDFVNLKYQLFPLGDNFRGPAGGLFTSPLDLARFANIFLNDGYPILNKKTIDKMLEVNWQGQGHGAYRAKGLQMIILDYKGKRLYGHFGDAYGVRSFMLFNPEKKVGINYLTNGGFYKLQESGIDSVQEQVLDLFIEKYLN